jgi:hypothetical protein
VQLAQTEVAQELQTVRVVLVLQKEVAQVVVMDQVLVGNQLL